jgi:hypothetical protein
MVQVLYLQPFDDTNKGVSRLAASIPCVKGNLSPLSFTGVPPSSYRDPRLAVYELNKVDLLKDIFIRAYERSAASYAAVRQSLGPRSFQAAASGSAQAARGRPGASEDGQESDCSYIAEWVKDNVAADERETFMEMAESALLSLHEGNFAPSCAGGPPEE